MERRDPPGAHQSPEPHSALCTQPPPSVMSSLICVFIGCHTPPALLGGNISRQGISPPPPLCPLCPHTSLSVMHILARQCASPRARTSSHPGVECHISVPAVIQGGRAGQNMTSFILSIHTRYLRGARHWSNPK